MDEQWRDALEKCALFRGLDPVKTMETLGGSIQRYPADCCFIREGDVVERLHLILTGQLRALRFTSEGGEFLYENLEPGYLAAAEAVCTQKKTCPYSVYTATEAAVWSVNFSRLEDEALPARLRLQLMQNLLYLVGNLNIRKFYKIDTLSVRSVRERVWKYLNGQAVRTGSRSFTIPFDREALANYLCVNRSVLSHELRLMEEEGLIRFRKNQFTLL